MLVKPARTSLGRTTRASAGARCQTLERRTLLASVFWDGGALDGLWNSPDNWSGDQLPTAADDVTINVSNASVLLTGAAAEVRSLVVGGSHTSNIVLSVEAPLSLESGSTVNGNATLRLHAGGAVAGAGDLFVFGAFDWRGGTMAGAGTTEVMWVGNAQIRGDDVKHLQRGLSISRNLNLSGGTLHLENGTLSWDGAGYITGASILADGGVNQVIGGGLVTEIRGDVTISAPLQLNGPTVVWDTLTLTGGGASSGTFNFDQEPTSALRVGGPGFSFHGGTFLGRSLLFLAGQSTVAGLAQVQELGLAGGAGASFSGSMTVSGLTQLDSPDALLQLGGNVSSLAGMDVGAGSKIMLVGTGTNVLRAGYPALAAGAMLDIGREAVIFDYPDGSSWLEDVRLKIASGYAGGAWTGFGICSEIAGTSQHAIGYAEASALFGAFPATFMGQPVDDTAILVRYTRYGDANLDGIVNLADFNRLAAGFGAVNAYWSQGDFDFDQRVNLGDFNRLAGNFGQSVAPWAPDAVEQDRHRWEGVID